MPLFGYITLNTTTGIVDKMFHQMKCTNRKKRHENYHIYDGGKLFCESFELSYNVYVDKLLISEKNMLELKFRILTFFLVSKKSWTPILKHFRIAIEKCGKITQKSSKKGIPVVSNTTLVLKGLNNPGSRKFPNILFKDTSWIFYDRIIFVHAITKHPWI